MQEPVNIVEGTERFISMMREFVKKDLGCGCNEEVFEQIRILKGEASPGESLMSIVLGERLLVCLVTPEAVKPVDSAGEAMIQAGLTYRDAMQLKRFRLVIVGELSDNEKNQLELKASKHEKVNVHYYS